MHRRIELRPARVLGSLAPGRTTFALDRATAETWDDVPEDQALAARFWFEVFQQEAAELASCGEEAVQLCRDLLRSRLAGLLNNDSEWGR
jgi:hypothetical protein